ncbi:MAG: hypothetical protein A3F18_05735 [Legionellales bacterium RIFCSPHIGHO2_12_FULL_37_14]|nr:MAG: hypothetical protein A3F18_05735 [Legionellales bacterium RIFCSPHIGHO2_12_FULL_37_14]
MPTNSKPLHLEQIPDFLKVKWLFDYVYPESLDIYFKENAERLGIDTKASDTNIHLHKDSVCLHQTTRSDTCVLVQTPANNQARPTVAGRYTFNPNKNTFVPRKLNLIEHQSTRFSLRQEEYDEEGEVTFGMCGYFDTAPLKKDPQLVIISLAKMPDQKYAIKLLYIHDDNITHFSHQLEISFANKMISISANLQKTPNLRLKRFQKVATAYSGLNYIHMDAVKITQTTFAGEIDTFTGLDSSSKFNFIIFVLAASLYFTALQPSLNSMLKLAFIYFTGEALTHFLSPIKSFSYTLKNIIYPYLKPLVSFVYFLSENILLPFIKPPPGINSTCKYKGKFENPLEPRFADTNGELRFYFPEDELERWINTVWRIKLPADQINFFTAQGLFKGYLLFGTVKYKYANFLDIIFRHGVNGERALLEVGKMYIGDTLVALDFFAAPNLRFAVKLSENITYYINHDTVSEKQFCSRLKTTGRPGEKFIAQIKNHAEPQGQNTNNLNTEPAIESLNPQPQEEPLEHKVSPPITLPPPPETSASQNNNPPDYNQLIKLNRQIAEEKQKLFLEQETKKKLQAQEKTLKTLATWKETHKIKPKPKHTPLPKNPPCTIPQEEIKTQDAPKIAKQIVENQAHQTRKNPMLNDNNQPQRPSDWEKKLSFLRPATPPQNHSLNSSQSQNWNTEAASANNPASAASSPQRFMHNPYSLKDVTIPTSYTPH